VIEFLKRMFGPPGSSSTAKERLRLVLMSDHLSLAPEMIDQMKRDLVDVISKYVEVDRTKIEVSFEQQDKALAMLANIPILSVNRPVGKPPPPEGGPPNTLPRRKRRKRAQTAGTSSPSPAPAT
jgi:cell division topological specificity factor